MESLVVTTTVGNEVSVKKNFPCGSLSASKSVVLDQNCVYCSNRPDLAWQASVGGGGGGVGGPKSI